MPNSGMVLKSRPPLQETCLKTLRANTCTMLKAAVRRNQPMAVIQASYAKGEDYDVQDS